MKRFFTLIASIFILTQSISAQTDKIAQLDSLFASLEQNNKAMGSVALSKDGKIIYSKAIGYAAIDDDDKVPATTDTKYRIGSISKMFTAVLVFKLIEQGNLELNTKLSKYYPEIPHSEIITIGNLLNHRSGIHSFTSDPEYTEWMTEPKSHEELIELIASYEPDFPPDSTSYYSNSNYVLLGYIIEKITGKSYNDVLKENITSRLALNSTYYGTKADVKAMESYSYGLVKNEWEQAPETDMSIPHGAGAIVSAPTDMVKFIDALFEYKLISKKSLDQMMTLTENYGMGMFTFPFYQRTSYGHNGSIDGFGAMLQYYPEEKLALAYCSNGQVYPMNEILIGILSIYFEEDYSIPDFASAEVSEDILEQYTGEYTCPELPFNIEVSKDGSTLLAQADGQSLIRLEASDSTTFRFDPAGLILKFDLSKNEMTLMQGGGVFVFTKK